jgi:hypothetical protein
MGLGSNDADENWALFLTVPCLFANVFADCRSDKLRDISIRDCPLANERAKM